MDEIVVTGSHVAVIEKFKYEMMKAFEMSDLGILSVYLGIKIVHSREGIRLEQSQYAKRILENESLLDCNLASVPMEQKQKLLKKGDSDEVDATKYRQRQVV